MCRPPLTLNLFFWGLLVGFVKDFPFRIPRERGHLARCQRHPASGPFFLLNLSPRGDAIFALCFGQPPTRVEQMLQLVRSILRFECC